MVVGEFLLQKGGDYVTGFIYAGYSTDTILDEKLLLTSFSKIDYIVGVNRDSQQGEPTITRPIVNEYGTVSEKLTFEYGLMKCSGELFTREEQQVIERWLTSPKYSTDLITFDDVTKEEIVRYCGLFTTTNWYPAQDGFYGMNFTFTNNAPYPSRRYSHTYKWSSYQVNQNDEWTFSCKCNTDELNEYVYPIITIHADKEEPITFTNITDNRNKVTVIVPPSKRVYLDCRHCIINNGVPGSDSLSYRDIGWGDTGDIYWPRLLPGTNQIKITGKCTIKVEFDSIIKRVGGWL